MIMTNVKKRQLFSICGLILTILANTAVILILLGAWRYSALERTTFLAIGGIIICILLILDVIFVVGYAFKDRKLKVINFIFALILLVDGIYGNYLLGRVNGAIDNMIDNSGIDQYETISVSFVTNSQSAISSIEDLDGAMVGINPSSGETPSALGQRYLNEKSISPHYVDYETVNELFLALAQGDVEAALLPSGFRSLFEDEEGYSEYLENVEVLMETSEEVKTGENESAGMNLSMEPFSVLLIGYAPETETYGLADSIIVATVNPQTMTVTMTSIPRDSYVKIAGTNSMQKINAARGISRQCLMDTVSEMMDIDIDLYMEVNFEGVVDIVDALGGIWIDSPVEFVGQDQSTDRGKYTVWVAQGGQWANGQQALAFARERHAMPNGDYDRQLNQQQVIAQIVSRLLELNDVNRALDALEAAGDNLSTNISVSQLTELFNYLLTVPNFTGFETMNLIDIQNMRVTGVDSYYYDYGAHLPLWIMVPYNGSIVENQERIAATLGQYDDIDQVSCFKFFAQYPYYREALYHTYFNETVAIPDMPDFVPNFLNRGATLDDVRAWANERDITLEVIYVGEDDPRYVAGAEGLVVDYSPGYATLVSDLGGKFTVYVSGEEEVIEDDGTVPNFEGLPLSDLEDWCIRNGIGISVEYIPSDDEALNGTIYAHDMIGEAIEDVEVINVTVYEGEYSPSEEDDPETSDEPEASDEPQEGDEMPIYTGESPDVVEGMTYDQAVNWCDVNGYACEFRGNIDGYVTYLWGANGIDNFWFNME